MAASWPAYRCLRRQVRCSGFPISKNFLQFLVIHTVKDFCIVNKAEVDVFLDSLAFSMIQEMLAIWSLLPLPFLKPRLNIWKFSVHTLLKPGLENFEHYFVSMWDECNCAVGWTFFGIIFLWNWNENWPFPVLWPRLSFQVCSHMECSTLTASSLRIWNFSAGIPSPPLALFIALFPRPTWFHTPGCLALGDWSHHHVYLSH